MDVVKDFLFAIKIMRRILTFLCLSWITVAYSQQEQVWVLGDYGLDFNTIPPTLIRMNTVAFAEAGASVCNQAGQLLLYTDGDKVWNRNYKVMPNGRDLSLGTPTQSSTQGTVIVPIPERPLQYYVLSLTSVENGTKAGLLYYSKIDLSLDGGLGDVVAGEKAVLLDSQLTEKLTAIAGSGCNAWIISHSRTAALFKSFEVTAAGISRQAVISKVGHFNQNAYVLGTLMPSSDGRSIASASFSTSGGGLEIFDFNSSDGTLSNGLLLDDKTGYYSCCFSPDGSKVFAVNHYTHTYIFQFDLKATNPGASRVRLAPVDAFSKLKCGPDGKLYFPGYRGRNLGIINLPDLYAGACDIDTQGIAFPPGSSPSYALPNAVPLIRTDTAEHLLHQIAVQCWPGMRLLQAPAYGRDFRWSSGGAEADNPVQLPGTYWVTYKTEPCVFHSDTFIVPEPKGQLPLLEITPSCRNASNGKARALVSVNPNRYRYAWIREGRDTLATVDSVKGLAAGSYTVWVRTADSCDTLIPFTISEEAFAASFRLSDRILCQGDTLSLYNTADEHFTVLEWFFGDGQTSTLTHPQHIYSEPGTYMIRLLARGAICNDSASKTITVDAPIDTFFFKKDRSALCKGDRVLLEPLADSAILSLNWDWGDGNMLNTGYPGPLGHAYDEEGLMNIQLKARFRACAERHFSDSIRVYAPPLVDLGPDQTLCPQSAALDLYNRATGQANARYLWNTGDTTAHLKVSQPGQYNLTLFSARNKPVAGRHGSG